MLTLPSISVLRPRLVFSQATARRNAARAASQLAQRRSDRDEVDAFLAELEARQRAGVD